MEDDRVRLRLERVADVIRRFIARSRSDAPALSEESGAIPASLEPPGIDDVSHLLDACMVIEEVVGEYAESRRLPLAERYLFRLEGQYWTIRYEGEVFRLRDSKGLRYLSWLMRQPGQEILACDLVALANAPQLLSSPFRCVDQEWISHKPNATLGDAGPHLDAHARDEYRRRLKDLREDLDEARAFNDTGRCDRIERELAWLGQQLAEAAHRGGAARASSATERARINVRNNLTTALNAIRQYDLDLWRHLFNAVKTGTFCVYEPEKRLEWILDPSPSSTETPLRRAVAGRSRAATRGGGG